MAASNLEDLLQEALADFEDTQPTSKPVAPAASQPKPVTALAAPSSAQPGQAASQPNAPAAPSAKPAPKGLGLGKGLGGPDPLGRRPRKPQEADEGSATTSGDNATASSSSAKPGPKLRPEAQRLADDLISLLQEAEMGEDPSAQGPDAMASALASMLAGGSGAGAEGAGGTSGPGAGGDEDDPLAQLFGRMLGGMMPPGAAAAAGGAEGAGGPPPEFAELMQQLMAAGAGQAPGSGPGAAMPGAEQMQALAAALGGAGLGASGSGSAAAAGPFGSAPAAADDDDALASSRLAGLAQQTRKTVSQQAKKTRGHMEGGAAAGSRAGAAAGGAFGLGSLLQELGGLGGEGEEGGPGANMMVDYIMRHLLSKDVLYGPLKEIRDRYPAYLEANQGTLSAEDYKRYVAQYESVQRVCAHYEAAPGDYTKLMDLIQEMQTYGDPPGDIVEEMTGGAGRDLNSVLAAADEEPVQAGPQPALDELSSELDKCKIQ